MSMEANRNSLKMIPTVKLAEEIHEGVPKHTLMCLSIGTPKTNKFSICSKWKIHYF